jgi:hypothetical protein
VPCGSAGPNGIGKSTIAHALVLNAQGEDALQDLLPFKYRKGDSGKAPAVVGADEIKKVLVVDEYYVSQFVFQPDEVVKNSFEIFIKTPEYQAGIEELEALANTEAQNSTSGTTATDRDPLEVAENFVTPKELRRPLVNGCSRREASAIGYCGWRFCW